MLNDDFLSKCREALEDKGWTGPDIVYLLCFPDGKEDAEFIARVTPDPDWSFQRWQKASAVQFTQLKTKRLWYEVREIDDLETDLHLAFESLPVYDVNGREMMGGD